MFERFSYNMPKIVLFLVILTIVLAPLPTIAIRRVQPQVLRSKRSESTQEAFGFKPGFEIRKIASGALKRPARVLEALPKGRILPMMPPPPPGIFEDMLVMPTSAPMITAPRMVLRNFPKPTEVDYLVPKVRKAELKLTEKPQDNQAEFQTHTANIGRKLIQKHARGSTSNSRKRKHRRLTVAPFIDVGASHVDIGSHGYSKLSYALLNPDAASMGPFVPHPNPPPPIRIQIADPYVDQTPRGRLVPKNVRQMFKDETEILESNIRSELQSMTEESTNVGLTMERQFKNLELAVESLKEFKDSKTKGNNDFEAKIKAEVERKISELKEVSLQLKKGKNEIEKSFESLQKSSENKELRV